MSWYHEWRPYVSVAERRRQALKKMDSLRKKGVEIQPIEIQGRKIAKTFWGEAWCEHLESFSDYANRLPRGRTYVRNGSVCHLAVSRGAVEAKVSGSEIYSLRVSIKTLPAEKWKSVKRRCAGQIGSLLELLQGRLSGQVMEVVADRQNGLFPLPGEMSFKCNCPDWASMCKHVAAVLYGVGARLDEKPELLFELRGVNHEELIDTDAAAAVSAATAGGTSKRLAADDLGDVFGIEMAAPASEAAPAASAGKAKRKPATKRAPKRPRSGRTPDGGQDVKVAARSQPAPKPLAPAVAEPDKDAPVESAPGKKKTAKKAARAVKKKKAVKKAAKKPAKKAGRKRPSPEKKVP